MPEKKDTEYNLLPYQNDDAPKPTVKSRRGFASLSPERMHEIASAGGKASHEKGGSHHFTSAEAKLAGAKGGTAVSRDREHMAMIGRLGGKAARKGRGAPVKKEEPKT